MKLFGGKKHGEHTGSGHGSGSHSSPPESAEPLNGITGEEFTGSAADAASPELSERMDDTKIMRPIDKAGIQPQPEQGAGPEVLPSEAPPEDTPGRGPGGLSGFLRSHRTPLVICGCVVLIGLAAVAAHAVLVRAPDTKDEGLNRPAAVTPAVTETPNPIHTPRPEGSPVPATPEPTETPPPATPSPRKEDCYTFVLLASDQVSGGTDTILVGRLDAAEKTLDLVNIPRDTLVNVSWAVKKVNTIYTNVKNDPEQFISYLSGLVGFSVDHYAVMDLKAVAKIVDAMGGIDYDLPRNMNYDDPTQNLSIHLSKGMQHLSGTDVVKALRFRVGNDGSGYPDGDLGRIHFQQGLLKSVASQFLSLGNIPNLPEVIRVFEENVNTDLTNSNLTFYAEQFLLMDKENIRFQMAPGTAIGIRGGSYYELDVEAWIEMLNDALNPYHESITEANLDVLQYRNGQGVSTTGETRSQSGFYNFYEYTG